MNRMLVSVIVIAYQSENTIEETLDSILEQTYSPIELVITDDGSTDNTKSIVDTWICKHNAKFENVIFLNHANNRGTALNLQSGLDVVSGQWIKTIAADDILLPDCISFYMENLSREKIYISECQPFEIIKGEQRYMDVVFNPRLVKLNKMSAKEQYQYFLRKYEISSPTLFINRAMLSEVRRFNKCDGKMEDWPQILDYTSNGFRVKYFPRITVYYRIGNSVSQTSDTMYNTKHYKTIQDFKKNVCYPQIPKYDILYYYEEIILQIRYFIIVILLGNKNNRFNYWINKIITALMPSSWGYGILKLKAKKLN